MKKENFNKSVGPSFRSSFANAISPLKNQSATPKTDHILLNPISRSISFHKLNAVNIEDSCPEIDSGGSTETFSSNLCFSDAAEIVTGKSKLMEVKKEPENPKIDPLPKTENKECEKTTESKKKKLVLDLDETLICSNLLDREAFIKEVESKVDPNTISFLSNNGQVVELTFYIRPYASTLLRTLSLYYDIIVFLA